MKFEHGIKNGYLRFRIKCADGSVQADSKKATAKRKAPWSGSGFENGAPFCFRNKGWEKEAITVSVVPAG